VFIYLTIKLEGTALKVAPEPN